MWHTLQAAIMEQARTGRPLPPLPYASHCCSTGKYILMWQSCRADADEEPMAARRCAVEPQAAGRGWYLACMQAAEVHPQPDSIMSTEHALVMAMQG